MTSYTVIDNFGHMVQVFDPGTEPRREPKRRRLAVQDDDDRPPVDWTGHQFKAKSELTVKNYSHRGRESAHGPREK